MALTTDYFKDLVQTETKRLNELCDKWKQIMDNELNITEEGFGQIRTTIGKTNLFINQRFKQFDGLVDDCRLKRGPKETKVEDLQGFWDMIYFQILDLHHSFDQLIELKDNNWRELEAKPEDKKPIVGKKSAKVLPKHNSNKPIVRSRIKDQIRNLKNKNCIESVDKNGSFGEKENQKNELSVKSMNSSKKVESNDRTIDKHSEGISEVRNVLKRTPLLNAYKK